MRLYHNFLRSLWHIYWSSALDRQYKPSLLASDSDETILRYREDTLTAKSHQHHRNMIENQAYGVKPRQLMDIYKPLGKFEWQKGKSPVHVFIHGGFWQALDKDYGGMPALAFTNRGIGFISLDYSLAPEASLADIVSEIRDSLDWIYNNAPSFGCDSQQIIVSGHSAGAHLAAMLLAGDGVAEREYLHGLKGLLLISGIYDLAPISRSYVNDALNLSRADIASLSPILHNPHKDIPVTLAVGQREPLEFKRHSYLLAQLWKKYISKLRYEKFNGLDHFEIVGELSDWQSQLHWLARRLEPKPPINPE